MYTENDLKKIEYFNQFEVEQVVDSLTGVISRKYIFGFASYLIDKGTPFSMAIMDLDNFKMINDNYGHSTGDDVLRTIAQDLVRCVGNRGFVGRYGGDEFIIICLDAYDYDSVHAFLKTLCGPEKSVRRTVCLDSIHTFVTGTFGAASFPKDSDNFSDLFLKVDKALYRGKTKGRNCYIVYVEEKHKDIDVNRRDKFGLPILYSDVNNIINKKIEKDQKIKQLVDYLVTAIGCTEVIFVTADRMVISSDVLNPYFSKYKIHDAFDKHIGLSNIFVSSGLGELKDKYPEMKSYFDAHKTLAIAISRIVKDNKAIGFLAFTESKVKRIWQDNEVALLMYVVLAISTLK